MSSLLKTSYLHIDKQSKRVIDTNELMEVKLSKLREMMEDDGKPSFIPGIRAEALDLPEGVLGADMSADPASLLFGDASGDNLEDGSAEGAIFHPEDTRTPDEIVNEASSKGEQIIKRSIMQAQEIIADAQKQAQVEAEKIREEARNAGYADGKAQADKELRAAKDQLHVKEQQMQAEFDRQVEEIEPLLVDKITDIYQYFFGVDLSNKKRILLHLIANTMRHIDGTKNFLIHVSREDEEYVSSHKDQIITAASSAGSVVEIIEDISLHKNECMIETDGGIFDCSLDTELKELTRKIRLLSYNNN